MKKLYEKNLMLRTANAGILDSDLTLQSEKHVITAIYSTNMGSDILERPDDEDSPEFQEYLKNLLQMQINRAKSGFASPSSGSSDAYISKLNRMKLERNARIRAGLPDIHINSDYTPDDYKSAMSEMQEPMVRDSPIPVGNEQRSRRLTADELAAAAAAEGVVARALAEQASEFQSPSVVKTPVAPKPHLRGLEQQMKPLEPAEANLVNRLISPPSQKSAKTAPAPSVSQAKARPVASPPVIVSPATPKPDPRAAVVSAVKPAKSVPSPAVSASLTVPVVAAERKLPAEDMDSLAEALQLLVKHRGGGPFGMGRLAGDESERLALALMATVGILREDTLSAPVEQTPAPVEAKPAPVQKPALASASASTSADKTPRKPVPALQAQAQTPPPRTPAAPVVAPKPTPLSSSVRSEEVSTTTMSIQQIELSLQKYITNGADVMDLERLRTSLVRSLGAVQARLDAFASSEQVIPAMATPVLPQQQMRSERPAIVAVPVAVAVVEEGVESSVVSDLENELKRTLGLLLKHRGGPGFGHGRLQGAELTMMQTGLRSLSDKLLQEAQDAMY
eukprot:gene5899-11909_t